MSNKSKVVIGQCVYSVLYGGRHGVIYAIHGEQSPQAVGRMAGIVATGGNACFDIVFDNGSISRQLPESILHGVQWTILDEIVDQAKIDEMLALHDTVTRENEQRENEKAIRQEAERNQYRVEYPYLSAVSKDLHSYKACSANIRTELKRAYPRVKFSVRLDQNSVYIRWMDGPTVNEVTGITAKYKQGHFNGMEDIYEYEKSSWTEVFGGVKYISTSREYSDRLVQQAIDHVHKENLGWYCLTDREKPTVELYRAGQLWNERDPNRHYRGSDSVQTDISQYLYELSDVVETVTVKTTKTVVSKNGITLRDGTKDGYVELLFDGKPEQGIIDDLKSNGFRWSSRNKLWYGKQDRLPALVHVNAN